MAKLGMAGRWWKAVQVTPGLLRDDLWSATVDPRPGRARPLWLVVLQLAPLVALAAFYFMTNGSRYAFGYEMGSVGYLVAGAQGVVLVAVVYRPLVAWWALTMIEAALVVTLSELVGTAGFDRGRLAWTGVELALQAWVLFHVALRTRLRTATEALVISVLTGLAFAFTSRHGDYALSTVMVLATAAVVGALVRGRNVARTQLVVQEERAAEERAQRTLLEERTRIARELHDVVAHHMSVIAIQAQAAPHLVENPSAELRENLESIRDNAKEALTELRQVLGVLRSEHPVSEERHAPQPTVDRLDELVANVRGAGLVVTTHTTGEPVQLPQGVAISAYRIIQEALSNVMRHAPGAEARVEVAYQPTAVIVHVTNTAPSRTPTPSPGAGHGLLGMRERAAMLGGSLSSRATADGGYEVTAALPFSALPTWPGQPTQLRTPHDDYPCADRR